MDLAIVFLVVITHNDVLRVMESFQKCEFGIIYETVLVNLVERSRLVKICYDIRVKLEESVTWCQMTLTQVLDIIPIYLRFLIHTPPNPGILLVIITFVVAIVHPDTMITLLLAQFSLYSSLVKPFNLAIILLCMLSEYQTSVTINNNK